jgi:hypothetical protein
MNQQLRSEILQDVVLEDLERSGTGGPALTRPVGSGAAA